MPKNVLIIFGTRPEAIKLAPLIKCLKTHTQKYNVTICSTGQHRDLLKDGLESFNIKVDIDLELMQPKQTLSALGAAILDEVGKILKRSHYDVVIVHGDTTTALMSGLAAFYEGVPVGHIEAGLRSFNVSSPFPEEIHRVMISRLAKWHFAPTTEDKENLIQEGIRSDSIFITGNTVIDSLKIMLATISTDQNKDQQLMDYFQKRIGLNVRKTKYVLITGHRRENIGKPFNAIFNAIKKIALANHNVNFIFPVHHNPSVKTDVYAVLSEISNIHLIEPLPYDSFVYLMNHSNFIITDSGGIQEEAPALGKPVALTRINTERPQAIHAGNSVLLGTDEDTIVNTLQKILNEKELYRSMASPSNLFGDGHASQYIVNYLDQVL